MYLFLAQLVMIIHAAVIIFIYIGLLIPVHRMPKLRIFHAVFGLSLGPLQAVFDGCILTHLEMYFRVLAGQSSVEGQFLIARMFAELWGITNAPLVLILFYGIGIYCLIRCIIDLNTDETYEFYLSVIRQYRPE